MEASAKKAVVVWFAGAVACMPSVASWTSHATLKIRHGNCSICFGIVICRRVELHVDACCADA